MTKDEARSKISELVQKYERAKSSRAASRYTEEETKKGFIEPLFQALGWNTSDKEEVTAEEGRSDYGFYFDGKPKFYLEAKPLNSDLNREDYANQAVRYSFNKGVIWAILTNFDSLKVFNAQEIDKTLADKLFFSIPYSQYLERFEQLWLLSKEAFQDNLLDVEAEKVGKKLQKVFVGALLYKDLDKCRELLTRNLHQWNPEVDNDLLDEGVQKILDRLIFLRVAEDREIEPPTLNPLIRNWDPKGGKKHIYESMVEKFRELNDVYNSNLFSKHPFEKWKEYSWATEKVVKILEGKKGYYEYDFQAMPADVLGSVYENYLGYRLSQSKKGITISKDAKKRKEHGIYYTPNFIVDYIVKNTLKPVLDKCKSIEDLKKIKVLDPTCGSGSFLVKALEVIYSKYKEFGNPGGIWTKWDILLNNIYGVDLDPQAVEITRLNLLINALDKRMKLPVLDKNIKNGNSLISGTDEELEKYFGKNFRDKKPFKWEEEFPNVFKQGGFDVIIGNPPWGAKFDENDKKYLAYYYSNNERGSESYIHFIERGLSLLKQDGILGYIIPNTWLTLANARQIRSILLRNSLKEILQLSKYIFDAAPDIVPLILTVKKSTNSSKVKVSTTHQLKITPDNFNHMFETKVVDQALWSKDPDLVINLYKDISTNEIFNKVKNGTIPLFEIANVLYGIKTGDNDKFLSKTLTSNHTKRALKSGEIGRYKLSYKGLYLWWTKGLAGYRKEDVEVPKIIIQYIRKLSMPRGLIATMDRDGEYYPLNNYSYVLKKDKNYSLEYLLGLINSKLMNRYFANTYLDYNIKPIYLKKLPIKIITQDNKNDKRKIESLVKDMIILNCNLVKLPENSEKWKYLKLEIEKTDKKIDEEVYKLYGLTPKEIEIVEKSQN